MKVTKYIHSCLLVEESGKVILLDPGNYTLDSRLLPTLSSLASGGTLDSMQSLDYLIITHEHQDHFDMGLVKQIVTKFSDVKIITTPTVVEQLKGEGINAQSEGDEFISVELINHDKNFITVLQAPTPSSVDIRTEQVSNFPASAVNKTLENFSGKFMGPVCQNLVVTINNKLTHPGDSHHFSKTAPILALPVQAPWGSTSAAAELAVSLKPEIIIPIHDWHWNEKARENMYSRLEDFFGKQGIKFIKIQDGTPIEV